MTSAVATPATPSATSRWAAAGHRPLAKRSAARQAVRRTLGTPDPCTRTHRDDGFGDAGDACYFGRGESVGTDPAGLRVGPVILSDWGLVGVPAARQNSRPPTPRRRPKPLSGAADLRDRQRQRRRGVRGHHGCRGAIGSRRR